MPDRVAGEGRPETETAAKPLARCLGEAVGHLVRAVRTPVERRIVVEQRTETRQHGELTLRRTVIDEIETPPGISRPGA
ncbi:MAG: hypothetical protein FJ257_09025 [Phycisphaerae bacterium]|nr:hypothetical protein [Phycisphaerae bacterium]